MSTHNISTIAHLIAEPVRAVILITLSDGSALSAGALAEAAGVTAQTTSSHLAKLLHGGLITMQREGRHRYYRLAGPHVVAALESLACAGPPETVWRTTPNRSARELQFARCCYDHLAGEIGVAITQAMLERQLIEDNGNRTYTLTAEGYEWLERIGLDVGYPEHGQDHHARQCIDWTERQHHMAGPLGARLLEAYVAWEWMKRNPGTRSVSVTEKGWAALREHFGIERNIAGDSTVLPEASFSYRVT
ncbi:winged helix-turn-helix transcriptional regulator [Salmonella enterica]|nr:winged helix-turn-helix transcriptional regulator [Salmonella enterica]EII2511318.1 winged helix-turn-helix transcriptional regulator [Salmonella enterica]EIK5436176.1 winged helix-turn-helix transcriptional regulator [Salmonella enterica]EIR0753670.1 winged helix-turn-helix transcriptional regulator [Salmonella enterica]